MYLSDGENKKRFTDFTLSYWRSMIQVFVFNVLFCFVLFWYVCDLFLFFFVFLKSTGWVGLLDRLINKYTYKQYKHFKVLQYVIKNQNVHIQLHRRKTQLSINQVSVYTRPDFLPSYHLFAGKIHIAHFSCIKPRPFKQKWKVSEFTIQEVWRGDTTHHNHSIYI